MSWDPVRISHLKETHQSIKGRIEQRLGEFSDIWESRDGEAALRELLFCILTPQSKAELCWGAVEDMSCTDILLNGSYEEVLDAVSKVRFKYKKAKYLIEARNRFHGKECEDLIGHIEGLGDPPEARRWFVLNIKGLGYKEASHFLRNIGRGEDLAILDRHILRQLVSIGAIPSMPASISERRYLEIEESMRGLSRETGIPISHLDLVFWYLANGDIFK